MATATRNSTSPTQRATGTFLVVSVDGAKPRPIESWPTKQDARRRAAVLNSITQHYLVEAGRQVENKGGCAFDRAFSRCIVAGLHDRAVAQTGDAGLHLGVKYAVRELMSVDLVGRPSAASSALLHGKGSSWSADALARAKITEVRIANADCQI